MIRLVRLPQAQRRDPAVEAWFDARDNSAGRSAQHWFGVMRDAGNDVREALHEGRPTACVNDAAFAAVHVQDAQLEIVFFRGATLTDSAGLLDGTDRFLRTTRVDPASRVDDQQLIDLIASAYRDMRRALMMA